MLDGPRAKERGGATEGEDGESIGEIHTATPDKARELQGKGMHEYAVHDAHGACQEDKESVEGRRGRARKETK